MSDAVLRAAPPRMLGRARAEAHRAGQLIAQAARANLDAEPAYMRTRLFWNAAQANLTSQAIQADALGEVHLRLQLAPLTIEVLLNDAPAFEGGASAWRLATSPVLTAAQWLDDALGKLGLAPAAAFDPDDIPEEVAGLERFTDAAGADGAAATLNAWYDLADRRLKEIKFIADGASLDPGADAVTCWPHHFDIATYVQLRPGDPERAPGVGVGMSPGDAYYAEPYFYVTPYPQPAPDGLPPAPTPGRWRREGFIALIATASELLAGDDAEARLRHFLIDAFALGRSLAQR